MVIISENIAREIENNPEHFGDVNAVEWVQAHFIANQEQARVAGFPVANQPVLTKLIIVPEGVAQDWHLERLHSEGASPQYHLRQHDIGERLGEKPLPQPIEIDVMMVLYDDTPWVHWWEKRYQVGSPLNRPVTVSGALNHEFLAHNEGITGFEPGGSERAAPMGDKYWACGGLFPRGDTRRVDVFVEPRDLMSCSCEIGYTGLSEIFTRARHLHPAYPGVSFSIMQDGGKKNIWVKSPNRGKSPQVSESIFAKGYNIQMLNLDGGSLNNPAFIEPQGRLVYECDNGSFVPFNVFRPGNNIVLDCESDPQHRVTQPDMYALHIWHAVFDIKTNLGRKVAFPVPRFLLNSAALTESFDKPDQYLNLNIQFHWDIRSLDQHMDVNDMTWCVHWIKGKPKTDFGDRWWLSPIASC